MLPVVALYAEAGCWLMGPVADAGCSAIWALIVEITDAMPSRVSFMCGAAEASDGLSISEVTSGGEAAMLHAHGERTKGSRGEEKEKKAEEREGRRGTLLGRPLEKSPTNAQKN